jgi:hypothetical protein
MKEQKKTRAVLDLGSARRLTKGGWGDYVDDILMQPKPGISRD